MSLLTDLSPVELATVASLLSDTARAAMLVSLLDGRARTAGELAFVAGISPQTASSHLAKLVEAGLVSTKRARDGIATTALPGRRPLMRSKLCR
jgi:DNA-binding transcriptional ArsR family regulator